MTRNFCILILVWISSFQGIFSQNCLQQIELAKRAYYTGNLREVVVILSECLEQDLSRVQNVEANRLIVLSNIFLKDNASAEEAMLRLLKANPEYKTIDSDPLEFISLLNSFNRSPVFSYGIKGGWNTDFFEVKNTFKIDGIESQPDIKGKSGFQVGVTGSYHLREFLWLNTGVMLEKKIIINNKTLLVDNDVESKENQLAINLPITTSYLLDLKKFKAFIEAGYSLNVLLRANSQIVRKNTSTNLTVVDFTRNLDDFRETIRHNFLVGLGIVKKIPRSFVSLNVRYSFGLKNLVKSSNRLSDQELIFIYGYVDDDFRSNSLSISLSYQLIHYNPKRKN